jgi:hypothetical protein
VISYAGLPLETREISLTFCGKLVDDVFGPYVDAHDGEREVVITLAHGESWRANLPHVYKRGSPVELFLNDEHFVGRVKFRRLNKLVCTGRFR